MLCDYCQNKANVKFSHDVNRSTETKKFPTVTIERFACDAHKKETHFLAMQMIYHGSPIEQIKGA